MDSPVEDNVGSLVECEIKEEPIDISDNEVSLHATISGQNIKEGQVMIDEPNNSDMLTEKGITEIKEMPDEEPNDIHLEPEEQTEIKEEPHGENGSYLTGVAPSNFALHPASVENISNDGSVVSTDIPDSGFSQVLYIPASKADSFITANNSNALKRAMCKFICNQCNHVTASEYYMRSHLKKHSDPKYILCCSYCNGKMNSWSEYEAHVNAEHPSAKKLHNCNLCNFSTNFKSGFTRHMITVHRDEVPSVRYYKCDLCPYKSTLEQFLFSHMKRRHDSEDPYPCKYCGLRFPEITKLRQHAIKKHAQSVVYKCNTCDYVCKSDYRLRNHVVKKHKTAIINKINSTMLTLT